MSEPIRIFIASSAEVKDERENSILYLNQVESTRSHLSLKPILWEFDVVQGSYPDLKSFQQAINPKLKECSLCIFIFYSKIGKYTKEEFKLAQKLKKKIIPFFKEGFSPKTREAIAAWSELVEFKEKMNGIIQPVTYTTMEEFKSGFNHQLQLYLEETYSSQSSSENKSLPPETAALIKILTEKQNEIEQLKAEKGLPDATTKHQLEQLEKEKQELTDELNQNKEIQAQQAREKQELEQRLAPQAAKDQLKQQALAAIEEKKYAEAEGLLKESAKESISDTASTFYELGKLNKLQLKFNEALNYFELAVKINPGDFDMNMEVGMMFRDSGYDDKAIVHFEKALQIHTGQKNDDETGLAYLNNELGLAYKNKGEYNKAVEYYNNAIIISKKYYGEEHPQISTYYINLGSAYRIKGEYDKSIEYYIKAIAIDKKYYGEEHPEIAIDYNNLGLAYDNIGEHDRAIEYYNKAIAIGKKYYGEEHPDFGIRYNNLGLAYDNKGEYDKAIEYYTKALAIDKKYYGEEHPQIAIRYNNLGSVYDNKGEYDIAIENYNKALAMDKKYYGEEHPNIAIRYNNLGSAYGSKGELDKACEYYSKALDISLKFLGADHPTTRTVKKNLDACIKAKSK